MVLARQLHRRRAAFAAEDQAVQIFRAEVRLLRRLVEVSRHQYFFDMFSRLQRLDESFEDIRAGSHLSPIAPGFRQDLQKACARRRQTQLLHQVDRAAGVL